MIDTIQFTPSIPILIDLDLLESFQERFPKKQGGEHFAKTSKYSYRTRNWNFPMIGLRLESSHHSAITKIECELPTLLYGHNGILIPDQAGLGEAIRRIGAILRHFTLLPPGSDGSAQPVDLGPVSRIDLVWQYNLPVTTLRNALQNGKVDGINKKPTIYEGKNIVFAGTYLGLKAYDKQGQSRGKITPSSATDACRLEFRITGIERIAKLFGMKPGVRLTSPGFDHSYSMYSTLMGRINNSRPAASKSKSKGCIAGFLASEQMTDRWIVNRYIESMSLGKQWASTLRQQVRAEAKKLRQFDLRSLIPPGQPPPPVDVTCSRTEEAFKELLAQNPDLF